MITTILQLTLGTALWVFAFVQPVGTRDWRGIVPLRSTRSDVERILNVKSSGDPTDTFVIEGRRVFIVYSTSGCGDGLGYPRDVPKGLVLRISITPLHNMRLSSLEIDYSQLKKTATDVAGIIEFSDSVGGLSIDVQGESVLGYVYSGSQKDWESIPECPGAKRERRFVHLPCESTGLAFDPSGSYSMVPEGFPGYISFDHFVLRVKLVGGKIKVSGAVRSLTGMEYEIASASLEAGFLRFESTVSDGVQYRFEGRLYPNTGNFVELMSSGAAPSSIGTLERTVKGVKQGCYVVLFRYSPKC